MAFVGQYGDPMKLLRQFDHLRDVDTELRLYKCIGHDGEGVFWIDGGLVVIASTGGGWDHVSVSLADRTPTWEEMERIKRMFFHDHETAMQLHVPVAQHISGRGGAAIYTLHLWRPQHAAIPLPPDWMVDDGRVVA